MKTLNKSRTRKRKERSALLPQAVTQFLYRLCVVAIALALTTACVFLAAALMSYDPADPSLNSLTTTSPQNWMGLNGALVADLLVQSLGLSSILLPLIGIEWGYRIFSRKSLQPFLFRIALLPLLLLFGSASLAGLPIPAYWPIDSSLGGFAGSLFLKNLLTVVPLTNPYMLAVISAALAAATVALFIYIAGITREELRILGQAIWRTVKMTARLTTRAAIWVTSLLGSGARSIRTPLAGLISNDKTTQKKAAAKPASKARIVVQHMADEKKAANSGRTTKQSTTTQSSLAFDGAKDFLLPRPNLLDDVPPQKGQNLSKSAQKQALEQNARLLESVLNDFGIQGEILEVRPGPVVTLYELEPAPGVKSSRVISLADDIARSMSAISARVAVVAGRNVIGIELPNADRETVYLRDMLETREYADTKSKLPLILGKDIGGTPIIADLSRMPHLLIAGTTGSGKSVAVNTMILSLLYKYSPETCRLILIDPKMLELSVYDDIPHLLTPVVTEPKKAIVALKWCVREMENRYRAMSQLGVRNINTYNERLAQARKKGEVLSRRVQTGFDDETGKPVYENQSLELEEMPYIVVVVDEMADLMLVAGKDIEAAIQRLAQMARAAGIHLIMATQRPSVDVITGTIKANFPTRISFQVTSKIDSRTILGEQGAEQLLGQGDMLHMAGGGRISRVHGPFIGDHEVESVVAHLKEQGQPTYMESITEEEDDSGPVLGLDDDDGGDNLYRKAVEIVLRDQKVSISYVQRRLRIGYNKAATLIEQMEDDGVISAASNAGKREILIEDMTELRG